MGEGGGGVAKSYDREKAWPSINNSILPCNAEYARWGVLPCAMLLLIFFLIEILNI
jgi:hypothetical protein